MDFNMILIIVLITFIIGMVLGARLNRPRYLHQKETMEVYRTRRGGWHYWDD